MPVKEDHEKWIEKSTKEGINCKSKEISERKFDEYDDKYEEG